jgi:hydrogenase nickel incorporation protein HypA/HybF
MHELAVAQSIVEKVDETAAGRKVRRVTVEIGRQSCISGEALSFSFGLVAEGTAVEGAMLNICAVDGDALNVKSMEVEEAA